MSAVYLAAPYAARARIRAYAEELRGLGTTVTATWIDETHEINPGSQGAATALPDETVAAHAEQDITDIDASDTFVLFTSKILGVEGGGGRHVETGYALAKGLPVIVIGEPENVFHRLGEPAVRIVRDWAAALRVIAGDES